MPRWPLVVVLLVATLAAPAPAPAAKQPLVVLIAFDELPADSLLRPDSRIDSVRYPGFGRLASMATWFPNAFAAHDQTSRAVPAILDGQVPWPGRGPTFDDHPRNLFTLMAANGYRVSTSEPFTSLCPPAICPNAFLGGPGRAPFFLSKRVARFGTMVRSIRHTRRPLLVFHHQLLPHQPWRFLPSGRRYQNDPDSWEGGLSSPRGFHDVFLTRQNQQRHLLQVGFVDREIAHLLNRLDRVHLLRRALLVVTADHGIGFDVGVSERRSISHGNVAEVAPVPLFVKVPWQQRGRIDRAYVRTVDVVPTIADVLNLGPLWRMDGRSAFRRRGRRTVRIPKRNLRRWVSITPAVLERARAANRRHQAQLFGVGTDSLFRIGPHRALLGQFPADLAVKPGELRTSGLRSRFAFDPATRTAPVWFTGRLTGAHSYAKRDLALAINGRVAALGRTFRLRGSREERFSMLVPESALREGANEAALFEAQGKGLLRLGPEVGDR